MSLDLSAIHVGDEITVRLTVATVLAGDIPLFNVGGPVGGDEVDPRPLWVAAKDVVGHCPKEPEAA